MPSLPGTFAYATSPQGARFSDILLWAKAALVAGVPLDESRVNILSERSPNPPQLSETNVRLRPLGRDATPDPGAGRLADPKTRRFAVDIVTRLAVDYAGTDEQSLLKTGVTVNEGLGQLAIEDLVLDAIDLRFATKANPDDAERPLRLTIEPVREVTGQTDPYKPVPSSGFTLTSLYFEARYVQRYTVARN